VTSPDPARLRTLGRRRFPGRREVLRRILACSRPARLTPPRVMTQARPPQDHEKLRTGPVESRLVEI